MFNFQVFPENMLHELIQAMLHLDPETRVGAHRILAQVLVSLNACLVEETNQQPDVTSYDYDPFVLSSTKSTFRLAASMLERLCKERHVFKKSKRANDVNKVHHLRDGLQKPHSTSERCSYKEQYECSSQVNSSQTTSPFSKDNSVKMVVMMLLIDSQKIERC